MVSVTCPKTVIQMNKLRTNLRADLDDIEDGDIDTSNDDLDE